VLTGIIILAAAGASAVLASMFMWWATKRSAIWAMAAGALGAFIVLAGAVVVAWFMTRAVFGS
jgi:hypothetical protein